MSREPFPRSDDGNPYTAPEADASGGRPTRWRIAVVTLLVLFGGLGVVMAPVTLWIAYTRPIDLGGGVTPVRVVGILARMIGSTAWIIAGGYCWKSRWRLFVTAMAVGLGMLVVSHQLLRDLED